MHFIMTNRSASYRAIINSGTRGLFVHEQKDEDQEKSAVDDASTWSMVSKPTISVMNM